MAESWGEPEPMRLLPEWAGEAVVPPDLAALLAAAPAVGVGENAGMTVLPESVTDLTGHQPASGPDAPPAPPPAAVVDGMAALIGELPDPAQTILRMRLAGRDPAEIAGHLGLTVGQVRERLHGGMSNLRDLFYLYQRRLLAG
ncbi:MAG: hypothetical protein K2X87_11735 [Gemmataceae bacterium]|nr:hypothetical protein [Gemmataceae bacterium]